MAATAALAMTGLLWLLLRRSWLGRAIVAVRMDGDAAALMGIRVRRVYVATFALGAGLAGAAGALLGLVFPISPLASESYLGTAFTVCVLGGLGSVVGAAAGGVALGLIESVAGLYLGSENASIASFVAADPAARGAAGRAVRPQGLCMRPVPMAGRGGGGRIACPGGVRRPLRAAPGHDAGDGHHAGDQLEPDRRHGRLPVLRHGGVLRRGRLCRGAGAGCRACRCRLPGRPGAVASAALVASAGRLGRAAVARPLLRHRQPGGGDRAAPARHQLDRADRRRHGAEPAGDDHPARRRRRWCSTPGRRSWPSIAVGRGRCWSRAGGSASPCAASGRTRRRPACSG